MSILALYTVIQVCAHPVDKFLHNLSLFVACHDQVFRKAGRRMHSSACVAGNLIQTFHCFVKNCKRGTVTASNVKQIRHSRQIWRPVPSGANSRNSAVQVACGGTVYLDIATACLTHLTFPPSRLFQAGKERIRSVSRSVHFLRLFHFDFNVCKISTLFNRRRRWLVSLARCARAVSAAASHRMPPVARTIWSLSQHFSANLHPR